MASQGDGQQPSASEEAPSDNEAYACGAEECFRLARLRLAIERGQHGILALVHDFDLRQRPPKFLDAGRGDLRPLKVQLAQAGQDT